MLEVNCFQTPKVTQPFVSQHNAPMREIGELFLHGYRSSTYYMIWELALNAGVKIHGKSLVASRATNFKILVALLKI